MNVNALHTYLFAGESHTLSPQLMNWLTSSRRFAAFAGAAKSKIRKKLRAAGDPESAADLLLELETAYLLLQERQLSIDYEPQTEQPRRPDFAVTFTTHSTFMLEVTRLRLTETPAPLKPERLADTVCSKLGQFLPQHSNILLIGSPAPITQADLHTAMLGLQGRAERGDAALLERFQLRDRGDFFRHYRQLSEVLVCALPRRAPPTVWVNPQAKRPLPSKVRTALYRSLPDLAEQRFKSDSRLEEVNDKTRQGPQ